MRCVCWSEKRNSRLGLDPLIRRIPAGLAVRQYAGNTDPGALSYSSSSSPMNLHMSRATLEEVRRQALELNDSERESLIRDLIASFDGPPDPDRDEAWGVEIQRRLKEIEDGTA